MNIKIADFGFSNEFEDGTKLDTFCGSPPYAAPELFQGKKYDGPEVDVWSLGVILYTMASGSLPFDGQNLKELKERVLKGKYRIPFYLSTDCESLIKKFLVVNPAKRTTLEAAMKDNWLNLGYLGDELKPYVEPEETVDEKRIELMESMGFNRDQVDMALLMHRYDDISATYHLLGQKLESSDGYSSSPCTVVNPPVHRSSSHAHRATPPRARPPPAYSPATPSPCYNGFRGGVVPPSYSSRRTPFSYNDSSPPDTARRPPRPTATPTSADNTRCLSRRPLPPTPTDTVDCSNHAGAVRRIESNLSGGASPGSGHRTAGLYPAAAAVPGDSSCKPSSSSVTPLRLATASTSVTPLRLATANLSLSPGSASPCFRRHIAERRTVHSGTARDQRRGVTAATDGTVPLETQEDTVVLGHRAATRGVSFFNKLTSRFTRH